MSDDGFSVYVDLARQAGEVRRWLHSIARTATAARVSTVWNPYLLLGVMREPG